MCICMLDSEAIEFRDFKMADRNSLSQSKAITEKWAI